MTEAEFVLAVSVLDASMDAVIVVDRAAVILRWNAAAEQMFGLRSADVLGRDLGETIVPEPLRAAEPLRTAEPLAAVTARPTGTDPGAPFGTGSDGGRTETLGQRADGSIFPIEITVLPAEAGEGSVFIVVVRDLTDHRRAAEELRESRGRLVAVAEEARRRVERDLHDGAQQQLVALAISLGTARAQLAREPESVGETLDRSMAILATAIEELRQLVRGVHNGVLTEGGLAPAWAQLARRSPIDVEVFASSVPRLPAPIEASMYYLVNEALTNAAKYGANRVRVDAGIWGDDGGKGDGWGRGPGGATTSMVLTISDDGPGGADPAKGTGLAGMSERVLALGGTVEIDSRPGAGTTLRVRVPVAGVRSAAGE